MWLTLDSENLHLQLGAKIPNVSCGCKMCYTSVYISCAFCNLLEEKEPYHKMTGNLGFCEAMSQVASMVVQNLSKLGEGSWKLKDLTLRICGKFCRNQLGKI